MNYMLDIAKLIGVEFGEEFKLKDSGGFVYQYPYRLDKDGMYHIKSAKYSDEMLVDVLKGEYEIIKLPKPTLTEKEKKYLFGVIEPFRDEVTCICKGHDYDTEWVEIGMKHTPNIILPICLEEMKFKDLELDKNYSLEALGL